MLTEQKTQEALQRKFEADLYFGKTIIAALVTCIVMKLIAITLFILAIRKNDVANEKHLKAQRLALEQKYIPQ